MSQEFRYSLTRICLKTGQLTLPQAMFELFPEEGTVTALDTQSEQEFELTIVGPRRVAGFRPYFANHDLEVNDELLFRPLEDGRYAVTPFPRPRRQPQTSPPDIAKLLDAIHEAGTPMTETEIRAVHPGIPADFDLAAELAADDRFAFHGGRWQRAKEAPADGPEGHKPPKPRPAEGPPPAASEEPSRSEEEPVGPSPNDRAGGPRRVTVVPYPREVMFPGDAALNSELPGGDLALQNRARESLTRFGFRVEGLSHGLLMAHAELGRRTFRVLVHPLAEGKRLDWAALLTRRRDTGADYLAVFGDYRDLHHHHAPSELAQATLWAWHAVDRALDLTHTVFISPVDLESHFARDGLYEHGLERFEQSIQKRIAARGDFSAVLARLAGMRAPTIFLLEDAMIDLQVPRDRVLQVLELLGGPPFDLIIKVGKGEFCLRYRVSDALFQLSEYALSLRSQLPSQRRERLRGLPLDPGAAAGGGQEAVREGSEGALADAEES